ncbi:putative histidine phosphatase superfamily, clade-1 [Helianthus annuus]|nr:putative histidine phosphatase superfamily, clade-1 [Helianthus annuus]
MNFSEQLIQSSDALQEMSHGLWEGCLRSDVYTPEILTLTEKLQPDFCPPSGESLRQVEFRMLQFLNNTLVCCHTNSNLAFHQQSIHIHHGIYFKGPNKHSQEENPAKVDYKW